MPTWTCTAVHLAGTLAIVPADRNTDHVDRLSAAFEECLRPKTPWTADKMNGQRRLAMMKAIGTMELLKPADGIAAQDKLIQHKGEVEHCGAGAGLRAQGDAGSPATAGLLERVLFLRSPSGAGA